MSFFFLLQASLPIQGRRPDVEIWVTLRGQSCGTEVVHSVWEQVESAAFDLGVLGVFFVGQHECR